MITVAEACNRVQRFRKITSRRDVLVHSSDECDTHWLISFGVPSVEDNTQIFQYGTSIVDKQTGDLYYPPSRSTHPIDFGDFPSNRQRFVRVTDQDLEELEKEFK